MFEHGYKCKECHFFTTKDEEIKEHISSSHFWMLAKKQKLSEPASFQDLNATKAWKDIFQVTPHEVTRAILGSLDNETFLACRLVCQGWRSAVNRYKPKWEKIKGYGEYQDALSDAIKKGQTLVAEMLVSNAANFELTEDFEGVECKPMHLAARVGKISMVEMLIEKGANIDSKDLAGRTPLFIAAEGDSPPLVDLLIANGADVNSRDNEDNDTPLHRASRGKNAAIVELLLLNGANVNLTNGKEESPLHIASKNGEASIVEVLLKNGADVKALVSNWTDLIMKDEEDKNNE